jgi:regulator of sigma E protease
METILIRVAQLVLSLSILVVIHECGHFLFAKLFKVRVEKFYLFFNPWFSLFKYKPQKSETEYGIGWLPLGGYVKISGMIDESMDKEALAQPPQPWEFRTKPAWQRLLIMTGGVLMNFILAFFIYAMIVLAWGEKYIPVENIKMGLAFNQATLKAGFQNGDIPIATDGISLKGADLNAETLWKLVEAKEVDVLRNNEIVRIQLPADFEKIIHDEEPNFINRYPFVVNAVSNGTPAQKAGLETGDSIVGINGERLAAHEIMQALALYKEQEIRLDIFRHGVERQLLITPDNFGKIGVGVRSPYDIYETVERHYNFFTAFPAGIRIGWETTVGYLKGLSKIFSKEGAQSLGGFGTIAGIFPGQWDWASFWTMTAFLSIILGVMNLLPIPALDGGHVMFLLYEVVSGRKPNDKFMEHAQMVGMALLLALLIYANGMDVFRAFFK